MSEEKKKLSKLCVTGFILSILPLVLLGLYIGFIWIMGTINGEALLDMFSYEFFTWSLALLPSTMFVLSLTGLGLSIAGVISAARKGRGGKKLGIAGIVLPNLYAVAVVVLIILFGAWIVKQMEIQNQEQKQSDIYNMGSVYELVNPEYDVSQYRIPEGYEFDSSDVSSSETELNRFAGDRLDTIAKSDENYVKGKRGEYTFLIIRRDRYSEWRKNDSIGGATCYRDGYYTLQYTYWWEFSAGHLCTLDMYKDPSDKFIIITNCGDYKVITEFFEM